MRSEIVSQQNANPVVIRLEIDAEEFQGAVAEALRKISKEIDVKGFRKGHAPRRVLEMYVGRKAIYKEALDSLISDAARDVVNEYELHLLAEPEFSFKSDVEEGKQIVVEGAFLVRPEIALPAVESISVERNSFEVTEEHVDKALAEFRERRGSYAAAPERESRDSDVVVVRYSSFVEGEEEPYEKEMSNRLPLEGGALREEIRQALLGKRRGDEPHVTLFMEGDVDARIAGKRLTYHFRIEDIEEHHPFELTEENLREISEGRISTADDLRKVMRKQLEDNARAECESAYIQSIVDALIAGATIGEVPDRLIEARMTARRVEEKRFVERRLGVEQLSDEDFLSHIQRDAAVYESELRGRVADAIRREMVLAAFADERDISPSDADVEREIRRMATETEMPLKKAYEQVAKDSALLDGLWSAARVRKVCLTLRDMVDKMKATPATPEGIQAEDTKAEADSAC